MLCENSSKNGHRIESSQCYNNQATNELKIYYGGNSIDNIKVCNECLKVIKMGCLKHKYKVKSAKL
jgi:hypothetical protein